MMDVLFAEPLQMTHFTDTLDLKLFVWDNVPSTGNVSGVMFALAYTEGQAITLLLNEYDYTDPNVYLENSIMEDRRSYLNDNRPWVYSSPVARVYAGG